MVKPTALVIALVPYSAGDAQQGNVSQAQRELDQAGAAFGEADPGSRIFGDPFDHAHMDADPFNDGRLNWDDLPLDSDPHLGSR